MSQDQQHLDLRSNIYLLPKEYSPGRETTAKYVVNIERDSTSVDRNETYGYQVCQFSSRAFFSSFIDMLPGAIDNTMTCHCVYEACGGIRECFYDLFSSDYEFCTSASPDFTSTQLPDTYNFFSAVVPTDSFVKFKANITMYFYDPDMLIKHAGYKCTIRNTDTCSFVTTQTWWNFERQLIIAYIHPRVGPYSHTTTISIESNVLLLQNAAHLLLYLLMPCFLIKTIFL